MKNEELKQMTISNLRNSANEVEKHTSNIHQVATDMLEVFVTSDINMDVSSEEITSIFEQTVDEMSIILGKVLHHKI